MNAVWTLCLSYLKKRKVQNGFIVLLILLATLMITTATTVIANTGNLFANLHERVNGSHQLLTMEKDLHDPQAVHDWWASQKGVKTSKLLEYRTLSGIIYKGKEIPNLYFNMMDTPAMPLGVDELTFASDNGDPRTLPSPGTVWVPTSLAYSHHIQVGDTIVMKQVDVPLKLRVSAIVIDLPYGGPFSNTARIWMNPTDYEHELRTMPGNESYMVGIRYDDYSQRTQYWERFERFLGKPYLESKMDYEEITAFYFIMNKLIGFVMIFLGTAMMLVALLTIGFTISDAILANYSTLGVLRAMGMRSNSMVLVYVLQYAILAVIAIIPGALISGIFSRVLIGLTMSSLRTESTGIRVSDGGSAVLMGCLVLAAVIGCVLIYGGKARRVVPMQAIRYGMSEADHSKKARRLSASNSPSWGFGRLPVSLVIGMRSILRNRKSSLLMLIMAILTSAVLVFGYVITNSVASIQKTAGQWGYDSSDVVATVFNPSGFNREVFDRVLRSDDRIQSGAWAHSQSGIVEGESGSDSSGIVINKLEGNYDEFGYFTLSGRNPLNKNELAIGVNVARKFNKDVGDTIVVYIQGERSRLLVTGIYQAIANMSNSARLVADTTEPASNELSVTDGSSLDCFIRLKDSSQAEAVASELNARFKDAVTVVSQQTLLHSVYNEGALILLIPMSVIGLLFLLVAFIIIYSSYRIHTRNESKTYGIYKSIGMSSSRIRLSLTIGTAVLSMIGAIAGIFVGIYALPIVLEQVLSTYGIVQLPLVLNGGVSAGMASFSIVSASFGAWASSKAIKRTNARVLVVD
ncbi:ABC transporter permease [Gorillibacterium massiliense]|uniref:ABC transporter permease n=1 Tax=Gorillibacterium massiliense TaxID=1280390 RepID=UPI0004B08ED0|nr:FtsX-like permease family protein [Gorillibacterium massiliense]